MNSILTFIILPSLILLTGILTITSKNPVISIIYLIFTFVFSAIYIIIAYNFKFLGISYIIVYIGAIAVLFLFIVMMIDIKIIDVLESGTEYTKLLPLGFLVVIVLLFIFASVIPSNFYFELAKIKLLLFKNIPNIIALFPENSDIITPFELIGDDYMLITGIGTANIQMDTVAYALYIYQALGFITLSLILLLAMLSAIMICYTIIDKFKK